MFTNRKVAAIAYVSFTLSIAGCGGGGGSTPPPVDPPTPPMPEPVEPIVFIDSIPMNSSGSVPSDQTAFEVTHLTKTGTAFDVNLNCVGLNTVSVRRSVADLANVELDELVNHEVACSQRFGSNSQQNIAVSGTIVNSLNTAGSLSVRIGDEVPVLNVVTQKRNTRREVNSLFLSYAAEALLSELETDALVEELLLLLLVELADRQWPNLVTPDVKHDVIVQHVEYSSIHPDGSAAKLSGLIAFPDVNTQGNFEPRDKLILLSHATGSTPSALANSDSWYILANFFAGHGYLVVAPDNFGRGITSEFPETYLIANRVAANSADLVLRLRASESYTHLYVENSPMPLTIIGYSQGGHSAIATWLEIHHHHSETLKIESVYSGGAPLHLYRMFLGLMQVLDNGCTGGGYCVLVEPDTHMEYATERILPGIAEYTKSGIKVEDISTDGTLNSSFVSGFLNDEEAYDDLKVLLQVNSYPNIANPLEVFNDQDVMVHLYHSKFDRLVPFDNTGDFYRLLNGIVDVNLEQSMCNSRGTERLFNNVEKVGIVHTLCGLDVLDEILGLHL